MDLLNSSYKKILRERRRERLIKKARVVREQTVKDLKGHSMKILVEVVATNMDTGHVAVNQQTVTSSYGTGLPPKRAEEHAKKLLAYLREKPNTNKVGPILITRNYSVIA